MSPEPTLPTDVPATTSRLAWASRRAWWIAGFLVLLLAAALAWRIHALGQGKDASPFSRGGPGGALPVAVAQVTTADVPVTLNALGTVTPMATVSVRPQVTGPITRIAFTEGQAVRAGDLLAQIDARPYQATLDQVQAQLKRDQAQLANARLDLERYRKLLAQGSVAEQQVATQQATVSQDEAVVAADEANVESARLNVGYCRITSPVAGVAGLRQVDVGNLVQANGSTAIVVVTQMRPMSVVFTLPEDTVRGVLASFRGGGSLPVEAWDRAQSQRIASGRLASIDNQIDTSTGTLKLRALFDNGHGELFPNQFVNVRVLADTLHQQVVVPGAAVLGGSTGSIVFVVNADHTASQRAIKVGISSGELMVVQEGLKPGETVVVDGADQLRDGADVRLPGEAPAQDKPGKGKWGGKRKPGGAPGGGSPPPGGPGGPPRG
jgi:multidrug efflux system membrane fusion protein